MNHPICAHCQLVSYARDIKNRKIAEGRIPQIGPERTWVFVDGSVETVHPNPGSGNRTAIPDKPIAKNERHSTRSTKYEGCRTPFDFMTRQLFAIDGFTRVGNLLHNLGARRFKQRLERQNLYDFNDPTLDELFSPYAHTRQVCERVILDENGRITYHNLPREFTTRLDEDGEELRSIPWSTLPILENNAYDRLNTRIEGLERDIETQLTALLQSHGFNDYVAFPEVNLTHPGTESIGPFLDSFEGDINQHIRRVTPDSQLAFHAVFKEDEGRNYLARVIGRPDNIIWASNGTMDDQTRDLARRFANLAYNSDNSSKHLFDPTLYSEQRNIQLIQDLAKAIKLGKLTFIVQESKFSQSSRRKEAREEAAHYILAFFCLLSAFDTDITLDELKANSRIIIDANEVRFNGSRGDLANFITHGATFTNEFEMLAQESTGDAINEQLSKLYETINTPRTKVTRLRNDNK